MKKILLIVFCNYTFVSLAQDFNKGDQMIGGSFSFSVFNVNNDGPVYYNNGNAGILPSYSWFIKNNLAMGIRGTLHYNRTETKFANNEKRTVRYLNSGVSVFLKKYRPLKERFGVYFDHEVGGHYAVTKEKFTPLAIDTKNEAYGLSYSFSPGVFYRFSKRFIGEGNIGGAYTSYYGGQGTHNFGIGVSFLQQFNLGINYVIENKKQG